MRNGQQKLKRPPLKPGWGWDEETNRIMPAMLLRDLRQLRRAVLRGEKSATDLDEWGSRLPPNDAVKVDIFWANRGGEHD